MNVSALRQRIWFIDTASLMSMAVDPAIAAAVHAEICSDRVVIIDVVVEELRYRATVPETTALAQRALTKMPPEWTHMDSARLVTLSDVKQAQADVADGRVLKDDRQHWAESTIIAMARRSAQGGSTNSKVLLSEDYDARRVASTVKNTSGVSIHGLLHARVQATKMPPEAAATLAKMLEDARRATEATADDFADPTGRKLGRMGQPRFEL